MRPRERYDANMAALASLASDTPNLETLALYEGWTDARVRMFGYDVTGTAKPHLRAILATLNVPPESLITAGGLTAYFTPPELAEAMVRAAEKVLGHTPSKILEPSAGTGRFLTALSHTSGLAIEPDPIFARILKLRFPTWQVRQSKLEDGGLVATAFDLVIGNAPFGDWGAVDSMAPADLRRRHLQAKIHDYFLCKSISLLVPGGVMAMITHNSTMDRRETGVREWLSERASLIGMWRLPGDIWASQGVGVLADLVLMRKKGQS